MKVPYLLVLFFSVSLIASECASLKEIIVTKIDQNIIAAPLEQNQACDLLAGYLLCLFHPEESWKMLGEAMLLNKHQAQVTAAVYLEQSKFASADDGGTICVWDFKDQNLVVDGKIHQNRINTLVLSADKQFFLTASDDGNASVHRVSNLSLVHNYPHHSAVNCAVFVPTKAGMIFTGAFDGKARLFSECMCVQEFLHSKLHQIYAVACSLDATKLFTGGQDHVVKIWGLENGACIQTVGANDSKKLMLSMTFSPKADFVCIGFDRESMQCRSLRDSQNGEFQQKNVRTVAFAEKRPFVVLGSRIPLQTTGIVSVYKINSSDTPIRYTPIVTLTSNQQAVKALAISADGTEIFTGAADGTHYWWSFSRLAGKLTYDDAKFVLGLSKKIKMPKNSAFNVPTLGQSHGGMIALSDEEMRHFQHLPIEVKEHLEKTYNLNVIEDH